MIVCLGTTPARQRTMTFRSLQLDAVNRATSVVESASGKVLNVARVLRTLGEPFVATGFLGGAAGEFLRQDMDAAGMSHDFVTVESETRTCSTLVDETTGTATEIVEEAKPVQAGAWAALAEKLDGLLRGAKVFVCSGTLAPGGAETFYADCVKRASLAGVVSIVDASGPPLAQALAARPFVAKPNRSELARTLGMTIDSDASLRDAMKHTIDRGASWVVVTLGAEGVVATQGETFWRVRVPKIRVVNPIGSGDSFAAGLAAGIARSQDVPASLRLATACGVANAMTQVAGFVQRADIDALLQQISVEEWGA